MILYDPLLEKNFAELGIPIDQRGEKCFREIYQKYGDQFFVKVDCALPSLGREELLLAHDKSYVDKLMGSGLEESVYHAYDMGSYGGGEMDLASFGSKVLAQAAMSAHAMKISLKHKWIYFLGGGMHHAHADHGRGFCLVNDIVIGIRMLQRESLIRKACVIDVDAHKGDGTAAISKTDDTIETLSIHMKKGWPIEKGDRHPSDVDIPIAKGKEETYLEKLEEGLNRLGKSDLAVIVNGSDPYEFDELKSSKLLKLSKETLLERDQMIYNYFSRERVPQAYLISGGYGDKSWEIHYQFLDFLLESMNNVK